MLFSADKLRHRYFSWPKNNILRVCFFLMLFLIQNLLKGKFSCQHWRKTLWPGSMPAFPTHHMWSLKSASLFIGFVQDSLIHQQNACLFHGFLLCLIFFNRKWIIYYWKEKKTRESVQRKLVHQVTECREGNRQ